jgi:hypothetical protein
MSPKFANNIPSPDELAVANAPQVWYDAGRKEFWIENARGGWIMVNESSVKRYLKGAGVPSICLPGDLISPIDKKLIQIQRECDIAFAGPLAGYPVGITEVCGNRLLVTSGAKLIDPKPGDWGLLEKVLQNLFNDPVHDQRPYVKGWLKIAVEALQGNQRRPGQALAIAGARGSGKSLIQNVITEILGGRSAKPFRYMTGGTDFNSELCGAEHLMIEDEIASTDMRTRRHFGARIKDFTVNEVQSLHQKNRPAVSVRPFWRLSITLNDQPEDLLILPPIDDALEDKIMLLKAQKHPMPMPTETKAERDAFMKALLAELPAFLWHLSQWQIPEKLRCHRFGITHFHHPELLSAIQELAPEARLLELIDWYFWPSQLEEGERLTAKRPSQVHITATALERELFNSPLKEEARRLLYFQNATGTFLGRLACKEPERVRSARSANDRGWIITPPKGMTP